MLRARIAKVSQERDAGFRHRGTEVSRIESLSDAVFGFGITLLVMSTESPASYADLIDNFRGLPAFAACFALLAWLWHVHFVYCRRYGLTDPRFYALNAAFLFVVVFYMYPLKFVFVAFIGGLTGVMQERYPEHLVISVEQLRTLFVVYGLGFTLITGLVAALYAHALSLREHLQLAVFETAVTRHELRLNLLRAAVGATCAIAALVLPARFAGFSGYAFMLLGPLETWGGWNLSRLRDRRSPAETAAA